MFTFNGYSNSGPVAEAKAVQIMNCVHCGKPIRQATIEELEGISLQNVPPLEWYKHIEGEGLWSCCNVGSKPDGTVLMQLLNKEQNGLEASRET